MNRAFLIFPACLFTIALSVSVSGQQVRLRSQLTPSCPEARNLVNGVAKFADVYASGNIAVQGGFECNGAFIYDMTNPDAPVLAAWYNAGNSGAFIEAIVIGNLGYFGSGYGSLGVHIVDLSNPYSPLLLGTVDAGHGSGFPNIHEMMVFSQNGKTFLLENSQVTSVKLLRFIDVTNPAQPTFVRDLDPSEPIWVHAMHIRGNRLFTSGFGNGANTARTEIYDIANIDTTPPTRLGYIEDTSTVTAGNNMHSSWTSEDGNYLYSAREVTNSNGPSPGDIRVYNISNPATPLLIRKISMNDLGLNAVTPHNPVVMGNKLYVSWYQAGVQVFDIGSDPASPRRIGQYDTFSPTFTARMFERNSLADEPWDTICGSANLESALPTNYDGDWAVYPFLGENKIVAGDLTSGLLILDAAGLNAAPKNVVSDFDGDRKTDISIFDPSTGKWTVESTTNGSQSTISWGISGDIPVAADYDGDGRSDAAVWRPSDGHWYVVSSSGGLSKSGWGQIGDIPVPGDFDADGKEDFAVWRPSNGTWYIWQSTLGVRVQPWGLNEDKPLVGDYDGDGKSDLGIWRPSEGKWYVLLSSSSQVLLRLWGITGDKPLVTDFDGDGRAELSVFRPSNGTWYRLDYFTGASAAQTFGVSGDIPIPADYDGDHKTDLAVFRPTNNSWYRIDSGDLLFRVRKCGRTDVVPSPGSVQPQ